MTFRTLYQQSERSGVAAASLYIDWWFRRQAVGERLIMVVAACLDFGWSGRIASRKSFGVDP